MNDPNAYTMLISGLPRPEALFRSKRPPLSRLKLDRRLRVLEAEDAALLARVEQILTWASMPMSMTDEQFIGTVRAAMQTINNETLRLIIRDRLEIRTCMAALRRRHRGEGPPSSATVWGYGRWLGHIRRNWTEIGFRLDGVFPWLREADKLLKAGDSLAMQRLLLDLVWKNVSRHAGEHEFDFEAVVIYVLKWDVVDRWVRHDCELAAERFEELTETGLGDYTNLFERAPHP
jgi:hypothetical protein